jgi:hypothetical protein
MPWCLTSTAKLAPKEDMKLLVAAYSAVKGEAIAAAALDVKTMQPLCFLATCNRADPEGLLSAFVRTCVSFGSLQAVQHMPIPSKVRLKA